MHPDPKIELCAKACEEIAAEFDAEKSYDYVQITGVRARWKNQATRCAAAIRALPDKVGEAVARKRLSKEGGQQSDFHWIHIADADELEKFYRDTIENIKPDAKYCGYAIGVHGSLRRDLDLIAVPWSEDHADKDDLARSIQEAACGLWQERYEWQQKPCGRWAVSIPICWLDYDDPRPSAGHIDLSVMPAPDALPDGYVPVPKEPLENMLVDGSRAYEMFLDAVRSPYGHMHHDAMREAYKALLAAAQGEKHE